MSKNKSRNKSRNRRRNNKPNSGRNGMMEFTRHLKKLEPSDIEEFFEEKTTLSKNKSRHKNLANQNYQPVDFKPRNRKQTEFLQDLEDDDISICAAIGPAGTGKTYVATMQAIKLLQAGIVDRLVITRPAVSVDEEHGFLPGSLVEKMAPWTRPIFDILREYYCASDIETMLREEIIEISPLAYMRGRSFSNCFILADELQLTTPNQMKMLLTRIGEGSKIVITGDLKQADRGDDNGFYDFITRLKKFESDRISITEFKHHHIERHPVVEEVLKIYGDE